MSIERVLRSGRRRVAFHAEDEYRLVERKSRFTCGDPYASHAEWRDPECAFLGTRRVAALAGKTGRPVHILHVSTAEEFAYLKDYRALVTTEVLLNHLVESAPDIYDRLGAFGVMTRRCAMSATAWPPGPRWRMARWIRWHPTTRRTPKRRKRSRGLLRFRHDRGADAAADDAGAGGRGPALAAAADGFHVGRLARNSWPVNRADCRR